MKLWAVSAVAFFEVFLFCSHWFIYHTLVVFWPPLLPLSLQASLYLRNTFFVLSVSFVAAALLGHRFANGWVALIYRLASMWMGMVNYLFWAAGACWAAALLLRLAPSAAAAAIRPWIGTALFGVALLVSLH